MRSAPPAVGSLWICGNCGRIGNSSISCLARNQGALQADGDRGGVGRSATSGHDGWSLLFSLARLANMPSEGIPYPLFAFAALLPWQLFSRTITESTNSLVADQRLITRVYFPRIIIPLATTLSGDCGLCDLRGSAGGADAFLWSHPRRGGRLASRLCLAHAHCCAGSWILAVGVECGIPRCEVRRFLLSINFGSL